MNSRPPLEPSSGRSRLEVQRLHVAVVVFPDVEELDLATPFGVLSAVNDVGVEPGLHVFTVAETPSSVRARHGLRIVPDFTFERCPRPDVLVIPGGPGSRPLAAKPSMLEWVRTRSQTALATLSVCTGARILAKAGLLDGLTFTTNAAHLAEIAELAPSASVAPGRRFNTQPHPRGVGRLVTSAGVTGGFEASLHVVEVLHGPEACARVSHFLEYSAGTALSGQ